MDRRVRPYTGPKGLDKVATIDVEEVGICLDSGETVGPYRELLIENGSRRKHYKDDVFGLERQAWV